MRREFNDTGLCVADRHYMVDTTAKMEQIFQYIEKRKYFTINRPRQFGKTSTQNALKNLFRNNEEYLFIRSSFEVATDRRFESEEEISSLLIGLIYDNLNLQNETALVALCKEKIDQRLDFRALSSFISTLVQASPKKLILSIDEIDSAANNALFLKFLALLRDKYLMASDGDDHTFHSVILIGVHDIKNLKRKIRSEDHSTINSPWNIAADFKVDMTFNPQEIQSMLKQYHEETGINLDIPAVADKIYFYTSGYPYLVSKMCKVIDEEMIVDRENKDWTMEDVDNTFKYLASGGYMTTLFDDLAKNLDNNPDLYNLLFDIVINGNNHHYILTNNTIAVGVMYGYIKKAEDGFCMIQNRIFEKKIYDKLLSDRKMEAPKTSRTAFTTEDDGLDLFAAMLSFQTFMEEHHSHDNVLLEKDGRLLFLAFLRPIVNGRGFEFKEATVGDERRTDLVVTYNHHKYLIELKRWQGPRYHQKGLQQLSDYLDLNNLKEGYLLIYDFNKSKEYKSETITYKDKKIFAVWV